MPENDCQQIRNALQESFAKKNFEKALEIAKEIRNRFPERVIASHFNLAYIQATLNQIEDAINSLDG